jgi:hypothetical protein
MLIFSKESSSLRRDFAAIHRQPHPQLPVCAILMGRDDIEM